MARWRRSRGAQAERAGRRAAQRRRGDGDRRHDHDAGEFEARRGLARTAHGALIPVPEAMRITAGEYRLMNTVIDKTKGVTAYSSAGRLFPEGARLAMFAFDGGCSFPHCPAPPALCEIDHVIAWAENRLTRADHGVPACHPHNVTAKQQGWRSTRINGRAPWIPPKWVDAEQRPQYNHLHDTQLPP